MKTNDRTALSIRYNRVIFVLAIIGIAIAIYVFQSFVRKTSIVCITSGCELVRKNPASYLWGVPVPAVGLVGYTLLAIFSFLRTTQTISESILLKAMFGIGLFGVVFVSWFTYTELFIIRAVCTWCALSAVNMIIIFLLTLKSLSLNKNYEAHR